MDKYRRWNCWHHCWYYWMEEFDNRHQDPQQVKAEGNSSIQQAQTINNGLDSYAVIRLSKDTTQEELIRLIKEINLASKKDVESAISEEVLPTRKQLADLEDRVAAMPRIYTGPTEPQDARSGDLWFDTSE